jgi:hypothetical protein
MKKKILSLLFVVGLTLFAESAKAAVITFDDFGASVLGETIYNGYQGFHWDNFLVMDGINWNGGFLNGVVSADNVAFNGYGSLATISSSTPFNLDSGYFTGAYNDGLNVTVQGYFGSTPTGSVSFTVNTTGPTFETLNLYGITSVTFSSSGGTDAGSPFGDGTQFVLDNLSVNTIPEPSTYALFSIGAIGMMMVMRRKKIA